jgi:hypothetical protein
MPEGPEYDEFEIELRSVAGGFEARVLRAARGRATEPFGLPFDTTERQRLLAALERKIRAGAARRRDLVCESPVAEEPGSLDPQALGRRLFAALFSGAVERRFRECVVEAEKATAGGRGLRLRLTFDHREDFALLATLPWELLLDDRQFLSLSRRTPIVRSINQAAAPRPAIRAPWHVLAVDSRPKDLHRLDTRREARGIRSVLKRHSGFDLTVLHRPSVRAVREHLLDHPCHVLHFMGHGGFRQGSAEELVLWFEGDRREAQAVTGPQLAEFLKEVPGLRLVVLNSCWGAAFPRSPAEDPFTGVAVALMVRGVPAVVAMQLPISDRAATLFSDVFYGRLAKGDPVTAAVTEARLEIWNELPGTIEWATPAVFLAGGDHLFELAPAAAERGAPPRAVESHGARNGNDASRRPLRLAVRSFDGFTATAEEPDDTLDLTPWFDGRYIRRRSLWRSEVFARLQDFLLRHAAARRPIELDFAAHATIAFAAGYCLEAKSGLDITLLQRMRTGGTQPWRALAGPAREGRLWTEASDRGRDTGAPDVALAVEVTWPILADVMVYLGKARLAVGRVLPMTLYPEPSSGGVEDGLHALQLAQDLALAIRRRSPEERAATLHLFAAAPNALLFYLGQLGRSFGTVQLYEHDHDRNKPGAYFPSLRLPFPRLRRPAGPA